ncbi:MAG: CoA transferase [Pseudomonadota bacterium]
MLEGVRVLDLTNENGMFCGYLLAQLGAEVVAIEPPGGSSARQLAPFDHAQNSLWWSAYAQGKQSAQLDLRQSPDKTTFQELVRQADVVIESYAANERSSFGVAYDSLKAINPQIICVAITPFGMTGPKADWPATDLTVWAASGTHDLAGDADRAPVRTSVPQSYLHAGADAAVATLLALRARDQGAEGQQVDVSAQQSSAQAALSSILSHPNNSDTTVRRVAGGLAAAFPIRLTWPCKDGYVAITFLFGPAFSEPNKRLLQWLFDTGHCTEEDVAEDWGARVMAMSLGMESPEAYQALCAKVEAFTVTRTQNELFEEGLSRGIYIAPTFDIAGLLQEKHFQERNFWRQQAHDASTVAVPGAFAKLTETKLPPPAPAPGLNSFSAFENRPEQTYPTEPNSTKPLEGLKVLDFMWVIAGPFCTRVLADYGATVIRVESTTKLEPARTSPPFKDGEMTPEHSLPFADFNTGKMSITVNPDNPVGREVILDLVKWADVVTESFSPKAMKAWGLDYDTLKSVNPDLIMLSSCLMGQSGPRAQVPGYGNMAAAITGFYELTGWADRSPAGPYLAYTDGVSPRFMLASLLSALHMRDKTGKGQHIDVSQAEAAIHMLVPAILDYEVNRNIWSRTGNRDLNMSPHGVYPVAGEDTWIAIACESDEQWEALKNLMGDAAPDGDLAQLSDRRQHEDTLDDAMAAWTNNFAPEDLEKDLISAGIPAHTVQNSERCWNDPQLKHRNHYVTVPQSIAGDTIVENTRFHLLGTPAAISRGAPATGEHNIEVLMEILGYDEDRLADVLASLCME